MNEDKKYNRYQRQLMLNGFGKAGQDKLLSSKVLVIGAGGLGCPALQYLAAAGVGRIGIVDFDEVELSNLQRQTLYVTEDVGKSKAETAGQKIKALNPEIRVDIFNEKIQTGNAFRLMSDYDIIVDGSDNFVTRYMVNDACVILGKPLVYGAVLRYEGQVGVFNFTDKENGSKTSYRDLFPVPPAATMSCNEVGVLGVLPGIIGSMQAAEVIKIITGVGSPLCNRLLTFNVLNNSFYTIEVLKQELHEVVYPKTKEAFMNFNYELFCDAAKIDDEITSEEMEAMCRNELVWLIDVREMEEEPVIQREDCIKIPMSTFESRLNSLPVDHKMVFICHSGKRSKLALQILKKRYPESEAYSLKGGLEAWRKSEKNEK